MFYLSKKIKGILLKALKTRLMTDPQKKMHRKSVEDFQRELLPAQEKMHNYKLAHRQFLKNQKITGGGPPPRPPTPPSPETLSSSLPQNPKYDLLPMPFSNNLSFPSPDLLSTVCQGVFDADDGFVTNTPGQNHTFSSDPTLGPSDLTTGPSHPTPGPSRTTPGSSHPTPGPSHPTPGPSHPTTGPSHPFSGLSNPTPGPSQPTPEPSDPTPGPSRPTPGPSHPNPVPTHPTPGPSHPSSGRSKYTRGTSRTSSSSPTAQNSAAFLALQMMQRKSELIGKFN